MTETEKNGLPATIITPRPELVEEIDPNTALTTSYEGLLARKLALPKGPWQNAIQDLIFDYNNNPATHAVANEETEYAKKLNAKLSGIKSRRGELPPLWVTYMEALANWKKHHSPAKPESPKAATAKDDKEAAVQAALARANAKVAKERAKREADAKKVEALAALSPSAAKRKAEEAKREAEKARLTEMIRPYALGQACVDDDSRPTMLVVDVENYLSLTFPWDIAKTVPDGAEPQNTRIMCSFCQQEHSLGESFRLGTRTYYNAQSLWLPVRTRDGTAVYEDRRDPKRPPKKFPIIVCSECAIIAHEIAKKQPVVMRPNSEGTLEPVAMAIARSREDRAAERGTRTTLVAAFGDLANGKNGRRDRKDRRHSAEREE